MSFDLLAQVRFYVTKSFAAAVAFWRERSFLALQTMVTNPTIALLSNPGAAAADAVGRLSTPMAASGGGGSPAPASLLDRANTRVHSWWVAAGNAGLSTPTHHGFHPYHAVARSPFASRVEREPSDRERPSAAAAMERPSATSPPPLLLSTQTPPSATSPGTTTDGSDDGGGDDGVALLGGRTAPRSHDAHVAFQLDLEPAGAAAAATVTRPPSERLVRGLVTATLFLLCVALTLLMAAVVLTVSAVGPPAANLPPP